MNVTNLNFVERAHIASTDRFERFTPSEAHEILRTKFAPWVQELNLVVEHCSPMGARLRLPYSLKLARFGETVSGQALLACADSAMAIAICSALGEFRNGTTVSQNMSFMRPIGPTDVFINAAVRKLGKRLIFGDVIFTANGGELIYAHATATWAFIP
jgi:acyl-coenzyme A thioesterase PaaI-like protein